MDSVYAGENERGNRLFFIGRNEWLDTYGPIEHDSLVERFALDAGEMTFRIPQVIKEGRASYLCHDGKYKLRPLNTDEKVELKIKANIRRPGLMAEPWYRAYRDEFEMVLKRAA